MCMVNCCMTDATERGEPSQGVNLSTGGHRERGRGVDKPFDGPRERTDRPGGRRNDRSDDRLDRFGGKGGLDTGKKIGGETGVGGSRLSEFGAGSHRGYD